MRNERGFVLVLSLLVVVVVAVLVLGTSTTSLLDRQVASNQQGAEEAYYIAQSGLQHYKTLLFTNLVDYQFTNPNGDWCETPLAGGIDYGEGVLANGQDTGPLAFGGGHYTVRFDASGGYLILTSTGQIHGSRATVQLVATTGAGPAGAWDNAIFATGQLPNTQAINGNVSVYGSVHIVNGELKLDTDLSIDGKAGVYNNYHGNVDNPGNSDVRIAMSRVIEGNEWAYNDPQNLPDLCSKVKIETGDLIFQGNGQVGTSTDPIYSVHLGKGVVRMKNGELLNYTHANDPARKSPLYLRYPESGKGVNSGYEGYAVAFPKLPGNYPDRGLDLTTTAECEFLFQDGVVTIPPPTTGGCTDGTNSIAWNGSVLSINGQLNTGTASLNITGSAAPIGRLFYEGQGTIQLGRCLEASPIVDDGASATCSVGDATVKATVTGSVEPRIGGFPDTNALGIISTGDVTISNKPGVEKEVAALMAYSTGEITLDFQTLVAGAVVATAFDLGNNVPKIAYHPGVREMAGRLCMPGAYELDVGCKFGVGGEAPGLASSPLSDVSYERR